MAQWREVAGYEGLYLVSDEGQILSLPKTVNSRTSINNALTGWSATAGGYEWKYCE